MFPFLPAEDALANPVVWRPSKALPLTVRGEREEDREGQEPAVEDVYLEFKFKLSLSISNTNDAQYLFSKKVLYEQITGLFLAAIYFKGQSFKNTYT